MTVTKPIVKKYKWGAAHDKVRMIANMLQNGQRPNTKALAAQFKCTDKYVYMLTAQARKLTGIAKTIVPNVVTKNPRHSGSQLSRAVELKRAMREREQIIYAPPANMAVAPMPITMEEPKADMVNHPPHYTAGGIETIDFIQAKLTPEEFRGYLRGNILKYSSRAGLKGDADEDLSKMVWYANKLKSLS
jgi:hypothetical protein